MRNTIVALVLGTSTSLMAIPTATLDGQIELKIFGGTDNIIFHDEGTGVNLYRPFNGAIGLVRLADVYNNNLSSFDRQKYSGGKWTLSNLNMSLFFHSAFSDTPQKVAEHGQRKNHFYNLVPEFKLSANQIINGQLNKIFRVNVDTEFASTTTVPYTPGQATPLTKETPFGKGSTTREEQIVIAASPTETATLPLYYCTKSPRIQPFLRVEQYSSTYQYSHLIIKSYFEKFFSNDSNCMGSGATGVLVGYVVPPEKVLEHELKYKQKLIPLTGCASAGTELTKTGITCNSVVFGGYASKTIFVNSPSEIKGKSAPTVEVIPLYGQGLYWDNYEKGTPENKYWDNADYYGPEFNPYRLVGNHIPVAPELFMFNDSYTYNRGILHYFDGYFRNNTSGTNLANCSYTNFNLNSVAETNYGTKSKKISSSIDQMHCELAEMNVKNMFAHRLLILLSYSTNSDKVFDIEHYRQNNSSLQGLSKFDLMMDFVYKGLRDQKILSPYLNLAHSMAIRSQRAEAKGLNLNKCVLRFPAPSKSLAVNAPAGVCLTLPYIWNNASNSSAILLGVAEVNYNHAGIISSLFPAYPIDGRYEFDQDLLKSVPYGQPYSFANLVPYVGSNYAPNYEKLDQWKASEFMKFVTLVKTDPRSGLVVSFSDFMRMNNLVLATRVDPSTSYETFIRSSSYNISDLVEAYRKKVAHISSTISTLLND